MPTLHSGKSSLLATLTRILDPSTGTLRIDSLDLSHLPRSLLRQHLTIVPQNPLHLTGSVRYNIDPFSLSSDPAIISSLTKVHLWSILSERGGLDAELLPDTLSRGQQQLVALARAILMRKGRKVVLLDEATSSVDGETEGVMKRVLKEKFGGCTVVMVAHRRETILGAEIAVVMDGGRVVEVGRLGELMARDGRLRELLGGAEQL
jgi:ATP-binding cassette subfamily C (CFTR/MRP) protein 1